MKMTKEHYKILNKLIVETIANHFYEFCTDFTSPKQQRWNIYHLANDCSDGWGYINLNYLSDDHIDTALKRIFKLFENN